MSTNAAFLSREHVNDIAIISFSVTNTFQVPDKLLSCDINQFQNILSFASKLLDLEHDITDEYKRNILFAEYLKDVEQKHSAELIDAEKRSIHDMSSSIGSLLNKISDLEISYKLTLSEVKSESEQQLKASQKIKNALESELQTTRTDLELQHQRETKAMTKRISDLEAEVQISSKSESLIRERCQEESNRLLKAIEAKNSELFAIKEDALQQREQRLVLKEQELQTKIQRQSSSVLRGHDGEHFFASIAKEKMNWDLVKAPTFSCDYSSTIHTVLSLFEIKNYTNSIPQAEVTKFIRDMKMHPEALIGIFISLNTPIQGRNPTNPITIDWIHGSQCVVYIQSCTELDIDYTFAVIDQLIKITGVFNTTVLSQNTGSQEGMLQSRIDQSKVSLDKILSRGAKLVKKISADKKQQIELIEANSYHSISEINSQIADIVSLKELLLGEYTEPEVNSEVTPIIEKLKAVKKTKGTKK